MRTRKAWWNPILGLIFVLAASCGESGPGGYPEPANFDLVVFQTNDRHSHWHGLPNADYHPTVTGDGTLGGAARWASLVQSERDARPDVLLLSAGDFTMGTMLVAAQNAAADLNTMKFLGFAAAALGNHELDWGPGALASMIQAAEQPTIPLLCANITFSKSSPEDDGLEALFGNQEEAGKAIFPHMVLETESGTRVGIFGLMGLDAEAVSNAAPVTFSKDIDQMADLAQKVVDVLRNRERVDVVILLAHLGLSVEGATIGGETVELAHKVRGIDVILSGHNHTVLNQAVSIPYQAAFGEWDTLTMEAGKYGLYLGRYALNHQSGTKTYDGQLFAVDDSIVGLAQVNQRIEELVLDVETHFLSRYPQRPSPGAFLTGDYFQPLAQSNFDLLRHDYQSGNLAYLAADAMREDAGTDLAAVSNGGDLRESLPRVGGGMFDLADAFIVTPLGIGPDGLLGYPLVKFHLSLYEIKLVLEATTSDMGLSNNDYLISLSGVRVVFDSRRSKYDRINQMVLYQNIDESDPGTAIFDRSNGGFLFPVATLYSICTTRYIAQFLKSFNLYPKDAQGNQVSDLDSLIVRDGEGREIKLWYSLARKLSSFGGVVPNQYNDDAQENPLGPYWRRAWDLARHPQ